MSVGKERQKPAIQKDRGELMYVVDREGDPAMSLYPKKNKQVVGSGNRDR